MKGKIGWLVKAIILGLVIALISSSAPVALAYEEAPGITPTPAAKPMPMPPEEDPQVSPAPEEKAKLELKVIKAKSPIVALFEKPVKYRSRCKVRIDDRELKKYIAEHNRRAQAGEWESYLYYRWFRMLPPRYISDYCSVIVEGEGERRYVGYEMPPRRHGGTCHWPRHLVETFSCKRSFNVAVSTLEIGHWEKRRGKKRDEWVWVSTGWRTKSRIRLKSYSSVRQKWLDAVKRLNYERTVLAPKEEEIPIEFECEYQPKAKRGETITYTFRYKNSWKGKLRNARVVLYRRSYLFEFISESATPSTPYTRYFSVMWKLGDLAPGQGGKLSIKAKIERGIPPGRDTGSIIARFLFSPEHPQGRRFCLLECRPSISPTTQIRPLSIKIKADPTSLTADGKSKSKLTITATEEGKPLSDEVIILYQKRGRGLGRLSHLKVTTGTNGKAYAYYTAPTFKELKLLDLLPSHKVLVTAQSERYPDIKGKFEIVVDGSIVIKQLIERLELIRKDLVASLDKYTVKIEAAIGDVKELDKIFELTEQDLALYFDKFTDEVKSMLGDLEEGKEIIESLEKAKKNLTIYLNKFKNALLSAVEAGDMEKVEKLIENLKLVKLIFPSYFDEFIKKIESIIAVGK